MKSLLVPREWKKFTLIIILLILSFLMLTSLIMKNETRFVGDNKLSGYSDSRPRTLFKRVNCTRCKLSFIYSITLPVFLSTWIIFNWVANILWNLLGRINSQLSKFILHFNSHAPRETFQWRTLPRNWWGCHGTSVILS